MSAPSPAVQLVLDAEATRRVRQALHQIEDAQGKMSEACATLSSLNYALPEWKATSKLHDKIKAHWYRVRDSLEFGPKAKKVCLDSLASESIRQRLAAPQREARP